MKNNLLALCGAAVGGVAGYFAFFWISRQGYYGLVIPGGMLGVGAMIAKSRSVWVAVVCGVAALALGLYTEFHFQGGGSLADFLANITKLQPITLLMIGLGAFLGFWLPFRGRG